MITVLLPTYNSGETIGEAVNSILHQSFPDFELLVLDDGSNDGTENIAAQFTDKRVRYVKLPHQGLTKTLNHGLSIAKYDIIARMDADDLCVPTRFEKQLTVLKQYPENYLISSWYAVFTELAIQYIVQTPTESSQIKKGLLLHSYLSHPGLMCHKKTLINCGGYVTYVEVDAFQDYETWLKIKDSVEFAIIPEVLIFQRYRKESLSNNITYKQKIMYAIQQPYYADLRTSFGIKDDIGENIYRGWREYFYGNKSVARKYWAKIGVSILTHPRIMMAWCFTFLPENLFVRFKESRVKFRLHYLATYFSPSARHLRSMLQSMIHNETA